MRKSTAVSQDTRSCQPRSGYRDHLPDDEPLAMLEKIGDYQRAAIPYIWIVDAYKRTLLQVDNTGIHRPAGTILTNR